MERGRERVGERKVSVVKCFINPICMKQSTYALYIFCCSVTNITYRMRERDGEIEREEGKCQWQYMSDIVQCG
jgi:hypothetical protein